MNPEKKPLPQIALFKVIVAESGPKVLVYGTPGGLRKMAKMFLEVADADQESMGNLPEGAVHHIQLTPGYGLCRESDPAMISRIDGKGNGDCSWLILQELDGSWTTIKQEIQGD